MLCSSHQTEDLLEELKQNLHIISFDLKPALPLGGLDGCRLKTSLTLDLGRIKFLTSQIIL